MADGLPFPDARAILLWDSTTGPTITFSTGDVYRLSGVPFPDPDSGLALITPTTFLGKVNYWDVWRLFPSLPEFWLMWENYDP